MKFSQTAILNALLATGALAVPRGQKSRGLSQRIQRRAANGHQSRPLRASTANVTGETSHVQYSSNWAGAVITSPPSGETFNAVSGTFTVPTPSVPSDSDEDASSYAASAWVGIDGDTYDTAILQTGIDFTVSDSGDVSYDAWYEWYPDYAYDFTLDISAGDVIALSVVATTSTSGTATIENQTTGKTVTQDITSSSALGGQNAEWIVEDFEEGDSLVAFADFGTVVFSGATAATSGSSEDATSATLIDIESDEGTVLTDASVSGSTVTVSYT